MSNAHKITSWIVVADGSKADIYTYDGPAQGLTLVTHTDHPESRKSSREHMADRPGRSFDSAGGGQRHAMAPPTDAHALEKAKFVHELCETIDAAATSGRFERLYLVAPPAILGQLRAGLSKQALDRIAGELHKDLTNIPSRDLPEHLSGIMNI